MNEIEKLNSNFDNMIKNSWTYNRLTKEEKNRLLNALERSKDVVKGTYKQRWEILQAIYSSFLVGCGYNGFNWREKV